MPLHLLGKKSWNVYNQANIDRVREDEERARQAAKATEEGSIADDANHLLNQLRGDVGVVRQVDRPTLDKSQSIEPTPAHKVQGHVDIDQISNMRFKDAAGRSEAARRPWYTSTADTEFQQVGDDESCRRQVARQQRSQARLESDDPLLAMRRGVRQLRQVEKDRQDWRAERERDLHEVEELANQDRPRRRHEHKHDRNRRRSHHHSDSCDRHRTDRHYHRHRSRHLDRNRSRSPKRHDDK